MGYHPEGNNADHFGMTIRDYFAAAALQAMNLTTQHTYLEYAQDAYAFADAMLKSREGVK
jgi:hypothetical protein